MAEQQTQPAPLHDVPHPGHTCGPESNCDQLCVEYAAQELRKPAPFALGPENPIPGPVDWTKPVRMKICQDTQVRVLAIDYNLDRPVVVARENYVWKYHLNGVFDANGTPGPCDLENIPEGPAL